MLKWYTGLPGLRFGELMQVYAESNRENGRIRAPGLSAERQAAQAEQDFYAYLRDDFFRTRGAAYGVWEIGGVYVSALRLEPYRDGLLLTALETRPDQRGKGYAKDLVSQAVAAAGQTVYSHVGKKNTASLRVRLACGFEKISDSALYLDGSADSRCMTLRCKK